MALWRVIADAHLQYRTLLTACLPRNLLMFCVWAGQLRVPFISLWVVPGYFRFFLAY